MFYGFYLKGRLCVQNHALGWKILQKMYNLINYILLLQVSDGPVPYILYGVGQHLHSSFDEFGSLFSRSLRRRIDDLAY